LDTTWPAAAVIGAFDSSASPRRRCGGRSGRNLLPSRTRWHFDPKLTGWRRPVVRPVARAVPGCWNLPTCAEFPSLCNSVRRVEVDLGYVPCRLAEFVTEPTTWLSVCWNRRPRRRWWRTQRRPCSDVCSWQVQRQRGTSQNVYFYSRGRFRLSTCE